MDKEELKRLADNPDFISGIYNYCDRWCERCPYTARCMNYALGREEGADEESRDINNARFWDQLTETLQASLDLLREMAAEQGIDLEAVDTTAAMEEEERRWELARSHPCSAASEAYVARVDEWLDAAEELFREKEEVLATAARLNLLGAKLEQEADALKDAVEVIRWYQFQIHVKLMRALQSRYDEAEMPADLAAELAAHGKDSDGSAKVALIGIDRSLAAWGTLLRAFPAREAETLQLLVHLERLRRAVEQEFPQARAFVRPGFDDMESIWAPAAEPQAGAEAGR